MRSSRSLAAYRQPACRARGRAAAQPPSGAMAAACGDSNFFIDSIPRKRRSEHIIFPEVRRRRDPFRRAVAWYLWVTQTLPRTRRHERTSFRPSPPRHRPDPVDADRPPRPLNGVHVDAGRGLHWWTEGWRLFALSPWIWIVIAILYFAIMTGLAFIPFIGQIASTLLLPILGGGVLLGARAQDRGEELAVAHLFSCFQQRAGPLVILALIYFAGWFVIWMVGVALLIGIAGLGALGAMLSGDPDAGRRRPRWLRSAWRRSSSCCCRAARRAVVDGVVVRTRAGDLSQRRADRGDEGELLSPPSTTSARSRVYGLVGLALALVASIPFGLGWLVLAPVFGGSSTRATSTCSASRNSTASAGPAGAPGFTVAPLGCARAAKPAQCACSQLAPRPTSATSGTASSATPAISAGSRA